MIRDTLCRGSHTLLLTIRLLSACFCRTVVQWGESMNSQRSVARACRPPRGTLVVLAGAFVVFGDAQASAQSAADTRSVSAMGVELVRNPVSSEAEPSSSGNPLRGVPLSALSATAERPIFSPSRRPPPVAVAPTPVLIVPPAPSAKEPDRPLLTLLGTIIGSPQDIAVLTDPATQDVVRLRIGQDHAGWLLHSVRPGAATFEKDHRTATLVLPPPDANATTPVVGPSTVASQGARVAGFGPIVDRPPISATVPAMPAKTTERFRRTPREL
jgi:hypothetical protein